MTCDDIAAARLESSNNAWLARVEGPCGGSVPDGGRWRKCAEPGTWNVRGFPLPYCPVHAARRLRLAHTPQAKELNR